LISLSRSIAFLSEASTEGFPASRHAFMDNGCVSTKDIILTLFFALSYQVSGTVNSAGRNMIERAHEAVLAGIKFFFSTY
jgi:hypothetical protein